MHSDESWYDTAEICLNGHVISQYAQSQPEHHQIFCIDCGEITIQECPLCQTPIRGFFHVPGVIRITDHFKVPSFCYNCGFQFPWTKARLQAAKELIDEIEQLTQAEKSSFIETLPDVISDTPRTTLAAIRYRKFIVKAGSAAGSALRDMLVDILSETAKKTIYG